MLRGLETSVLIDTLGEMQVHEGLECSFDHIGLAGGAERFGYRIFNSCALQHRTNRFTRDYSGAETRGP